MIEKCPFCKSEQVEVEIERHSWEESWRVYCFNCSAIGPISYEGEKDAIFLWNQARISV